MRILIDADACPVKEETIKIGEYYGVDVIMVTTTDHYSSHIIDSKYLQVIYIEPGIEAVDYYLLSIAKKDDIVVTQDYGLASLLFSKYKVIHHSGKVYDEFNIDQLLFERHLGQKMRKAGKKNKGTGKFTKDDRDRFVESLSRIIEDSEQESHK
ncbi:YaiI/YqxD family protein [Facklamia miroungae]|uniref:UPF0178 protein SAMN05421791_102198 n=1 Tax=Facklamia miroungae TaxID=120956 RepID=A0A1G7QS39_9LACT|nr:YaiI/YqxD family protein [Facklamia miroungae]NKZ29044.1 YaiI/YqxD family protein [Facklamia miroungae]SDG01351.1 hypothetical protein SAMN05421791_102198 [Facklamia miroungae]